MERTGLYARPRQASPFTFVAAAAVVKRILEGRSYWQAMTDAGFSLNTALRWKRWGEAEEDPYFSFLQLVRAARVRSIERKTGISVEEARLVINGMKECEYDSRIRRI